MGIKYFCDACGREMNERNICATVFGYPTEDKRNIPFLEYQLICRECIKAFRNAINETVLKAKVELDKIKITND